MASVLSRTNISSAKFLRLLRSNEGSLMPLFMYARKPRFSATRTSTGRWYFSVFPKIAFNLALNFSGLLVHITRCQCSCRYSFPRRFSHPRSALPIIVLLPAALILSLNQRFAFRTSILCNSSGRYVNRFGMIVTNASFFANFLLLSAVMSFAWTSTLAF